MEVDARSYVLDHNLHGLFTLDLQQDLCKLHESSNDILELELIRPDFEAGNPKIGDFQLSCVKKAADLRSDRLPEIIIQQTDFLSFFGALATLEEDRTEHALGMLRAVLRMARHIAMQFKHVLDVARPASLAFQVQPVIQTPGHGSWPSGHATEAFAVATVFDALTHKGKAPERTESSPALRLAARIADNRTVAGVHFPTDSYAGALLGISIGDVLVGYFSGGSIDKAKRRYDGKIERDDFSLARLLQKAEIQPNPKPVGKIELLNELWKAAVREMN
ncbi:phosphatase PAP2 family protein [Oricola cellulosilytica]|uniref:Phosphatase PAP2 family protein n=2 Tax=Oricola cellulosilytica TaxID=1429082 RepID=A0A4R0PEQ5_9HYPH|nr:phosphatase PAP2 family protein [Oricola cellulosilytica]